MCKSTVCLDDTLVNKSLRKHGSDRLVTSTQAFGQGNDVRYYAFLLKGKITTGTPTTSHHFIHDQQYLVAVTDFADGLKISLNSRYRTQRCAYDSLNQKS